MRRSSQIAGGWIASLLLLTGVQAAEAERARPVRDEGLLRIEAEPEREVPSAVSSLPRGIRTYGTVPFAFATSDDLAAGVAGKAGSPVASATLGAVRKISGVPMAGRVTAFALNPAGTTAVYIADQEIAGRFELYRAPVNGLSPATKLSAGLPLEAGDAGVRSFQITPDGARVVFLADAFHGGGVDDVFSVPIDGSAAPVRLNAGAEAPVSAFGVAPNSATVVFFAIDSVYASGRVELYGATIGTAASAKQISDTGTGVAGASVAFAVISPNSARAVYAADTVVDGRYQWSSVPTGAVAPGSDVTLSAALGSVSQLAISPDSATVAYTADEITPGIYEVFSVPITGGARTRLNPAMAGAGARTVAFSPDGTRVGYLADQNTFDVVEVYRARTGIAASGIRLNTPLAGTQMADTLNFSPDGTRVLYEADQSAAGTFELYSVPADGGAVMTLHGLVAPADAGYFQGLGTPIVGRRAVYPVLGSQTDLFSVPFNGSGPFVRLNDALAAGVTVRDAFVPQGSRRLLAYGIGSSAGNVTTSLFAVPIRRDLAPEQVNMTAGGAAVGVLAYAVSGDEDYAVYVQDQDTTGKPELYSRELDTDGDTIINAQDNCRYASNPTQSGVVLGRTVVASSKTSFGWNENLDVRWVRGPLNLVATLVTDASGSLLDASSLTDAATPAANGGFYYLFAPDCPGRSYQSELGREPARDAAAFP